MKLKNKRGKINILIIVTFLLLIAILLIMSNSEKLKNIMIHNKEKEDVELLSYSIYDNQDNNNVKVLVRINSVDGIEYIEKPDGDRINTYGKTEVSLDYLAKSNEQEEFKIKEKNKNEIETKTIQVNESSIKNKAINVEKISESQGLKFINIKNVIDMDGYTTYYQIGKDGEWIKGEGNILLVDYDLTTSNLLNEDNTITVTAKVVNNSLGNVVNLSQNYEVDTNSTVQSLEADSLIDAMDKYDFGTGIFKVSVNQTIYNLKVYSYEGDMNLDSDTKATFGTEQDVGNSTEDAKNMIVLKVKGDLTIGSTLKPYASNIGYGGPKGMFIYCTGTLTNNGTISMTARGAKAEGQDVYLYKNIDGSYEYVPAVGEAGAAAVHINNQTSPRKSRNEWYW